MSEYQYYEFLAIDRPLSADDLAYVRTLSSRVRPTPTQAAFTYSFSGFPGQPLELLAKHYDVMLFIANWGSKQLAFRLPKAAIDQQALQPYYYGVEQIELSTVGSSVILDINFNMEEGFGWIEGEGLLGGLAPLRDDLLRSDLRALYLAWLASAAKSIGYEQPDEAWDDGDDEQDDVDEPSEGGGDPIEPPVPPGLGQLSAPLQALIDFLEIDQDLVGAAALASPPLKAAEEPIERWVPLLPEAERNAFLARAARGEPIGAELLRRLRAVGDGARVQAAETPRRRFSQLQAAAEQVRERREQAEREQAERARLANLAALAQRAEQVWAQLPGLLAKRTAAGYEEAVALLADLQDLAVHRKDYASFEARASRALAPHAGSAALSRRLREKGIVV